MAAFFSTSCFSMKLSEKSIFGRNYTRVFSNGVRYIDNENSRVVTESDFSNARTEDRRRNGWFLPTTNEEFSVLYENFGDAVKAGTSVLWPMVGGTIQDEIRSKCIDKKAPETFLEKVVGFAKIVSTFHDKSFVAPIIGPCPNDLHSFLWSALSGLSSLQKEFKEHLSVDDLSIPLALAKSCEIMDIIQPGEGGCFLRLFNTFCLDKSYKQSPEYKAMYAEVEKMLTGGITLETK
jgi:hypothetical protein